MGAHYELKQLFKRAKEAAPRVQDFSCALAQQIGLDPDRAIIKGPKKNFSRIFQKAAKGDMKKATTDLCRYRIHFNNPGQILHLRMIFHTAENPDSFFSKWQEKGVRIHSIDDSFATPKEHGFRGLQILIDIQLRKGKSKTCEIQLLHEDMKDINNESHAHFKAIRELQHRTLIEKDLTPEEHARLQKHKKDNKRLYKDAAEKFGLNVLEIIPAADEFYNYDGFEDLPVNTPP